MSKAGFPIMLILLPILERYLREVSGTVEKDLGDDFYLALMEMNPELDSPGLARNFWHTYRNGLLHQLTFSLFSRKGVRMPPACITFKQDTAIAVLDGGQFVVNPVSLARRVMRAILDDYQEMAGSNSPNHPTPFVFSTNGSINMTGTASDERWRQ